MQNSMRDADDADRDRREDQRRRVAPAERKGEPRLARPAGSGGRGPVSCMAK